MKSYKIPTIESVSPAVQEMFGTIKKEKGVLPNIYAFIGSSENALSNFMAFENSLSKSVFTAKEQEAIFLAVSSVNGCKYCQSAHTYIAKMHGFTEEETVQIRNGSYANGKIGAITKLAADIQRTHGKPSKGLLEDFFAHGYNEKALADLLSVMIFIIMPNYLNNITEIEIDFPLVNI